MTGGWVRQDQGEGSVLEEAISRARDLLEKRGLLDAPVSVSVSLLSAEEATGTRGRRDFPVMLGRERVIEADLLGTKAHVFTDAPREFEGVLGNLFATTPSSSGDRALLVAALNAALKHLGLIWGVRHCRGEEPEACASEITGIVRAYWGNTSVGLVGLNPALLESLVARFGSQNVRAIDLSRGNVGTTRWGVEIGDGMTDTEKLVQFSDIVLITGTTIVNGSLDAILGLIRRYHKGYLVYGVTVAGVSHLMDLPRICPYGKG